MPQSLSMALELPRFDSSSVARSLAQIADQEGDFADVFFETLEVVELADDPNPPEWRVRTESGFMIRLARGASAWLASRDRMDSESFAAALRQVARAAPQATYPPPAFEPVAKEETDSFAEVLSFPTRVTRALRHHHVAFPLRLTVRRHRRRLHWIGTRLVPEAESESFYSCAAWTPWGRCGLLSIDLNETTAESLASRLIERFKARDAEPPTSDRPVLILAPAATSVLLHEAVAHSLEADTLALTGRPDSAPGVDLGSTLLNVLDDPGSLPEPVRRQTDDEGVPVRRRWLVREGIVDQPLADQAHAARFESMEPGAGRRASRTHAPVPRSSHLEMLAAQTAEADLFAEAGGGLFIQEIERGSLDPLSGRFVLDVGSARRIEGGALGGAAGRFRVRGSIGRLGESLRAVSDETTFVGGGWCAKGGLRMPVWGTAPAIRLEGLEIEA